MLFLHRPSVFWPTPGIPGVLADRASLGQRRIRHVQLSLAGKPAGFDLCPVDRTGVRDRFTLERL